MKKCVAIVSVLLLAAAVAIAQAQGTQGDEKGVRDALQAYGDAFSRGQALATGPAFTMDAVYITDEGERVAGRQAIQKRLQDYLATNKGDKMRMTADAIRFVTPDIAEVEGTVDIRGPGGPPDISGFAALLVKREGRWQMQTLRDLVPPVDSESLIAEDALASLEWMVGEWSHSAGGASVKVNCRYDESGNFLLWDYTVQEAGKKVMTVQQRVGWDPQAGAFRSWVFDSVGGFAEGRWDPERDGGYEIRQTGVLPDGSSASALCRLIPVDKDNFRYRMTDRRVNGGKLADADMTFKRTAGQVQR